MSDTHPADTQPGEPAPQQPVPTTESPSPVPGPAAPVGVDTPPMVAPDDVKASTPEPTGDTPAAQGDIRHVDTSDQFDTVPEGDRNVPGYVSEVEKPPDNLPTAGDLRAAGYVVDPRVADDAVPSGYTVDSPTPYGEIRPVMVPQPDDSRRLTPMQFINQTQDAPESAPPSPTPSETTKEEGGTGEPTTTKEGGSADASVSP